MWGLWHGEGLSREACLPPAVPGFSKLIDHKFVSVICDLPVRHLKNAILGLFTLSAEAVFKNGVSIAKDVAFNDTVG